MFYRVDEYRCAWGPIWRGLLTRIHVQGFGSVPFFSVLTGPDLGFCFVGGGDRIERRYWMDPTALIFLYCSWLLGSDFREGGKNQTGTWWELELPICLPRYWVISSNILSSFLLKFKNIKIWTHSLFNYSSLSKFQVCEPNKTLFVAIVLSCEYDLKFLRTAKVINFRSCLAGELN